MDTKRVLKLIGGQAAASRLLGKPVQVIANAAGNKKPLDKASQAQLAWAAADAAISTYNLKPSPFVRAWVAQMLQGNSRVTLPRGFAHKPIAL